MHESSRSAHLCFFLVVSKVTEAKSFSRNWKWKALVLVKSGDLGSLMPSIAASFWSPSLIFLKHFSFKHISATTYSIDFARHKIHTFDCLVVNVAMDAKHLHQWMSPNISFLLGVICWMRVAIAASTLPSMAWRSSFRSVRRVPPRMQGFKGVWSRWGKGGWVWDSCWETWYTRLFYIIIHYVEYILIVAAKKV